jgi:hypothetical protein
MNGKKMILNFVALVFLAAIFVLPSTFQAAEPDKKQVKAGQRSRQGGAERVNSEQREKREAERIQKSLGATDAEWKSMGAKVMKAMELSQQLNRMTGRPSGRGSRAREGRGNQEGTDASSRPARERVGAAREQGKIQKSASELQTLLENKAATPADIKSKLEALRNARASAKAELAQIQVELRKIVSLPQEAQLVLMGVLE